MRRAARGALSLAGAGFALHAIWLTTTPGSETATRALTDLVPVAVPVAAALACWGARDRAFRRFWGLLGASALSWGLGGAAWTYYELAAHREVPFPSLADVGYLGAIPLAAAGLLSFPGLTGAPSRLRALLDGLIICASLLFVSWALVLGPLYRAGEGTVLARAIGLAYPLGDVVVASLVVFVAARAAPGSRASLMLVGAGLLARAVADSGFAYLTLHDAYHSGHPLDLGWSAGYLLVAAAAAGQAPPRPRGPRAPVGGRLGLAAPYLPVLLGVGVAGFVEVSRGSLEPFLFWTASGLVLLVVARQVLTLWENLALTRGLELRVAERTADLRRALRDLSEAHRLQEAFLSSASHELRTPLTGILAAARTLLRPELELGTKARGLVELLLRNGERLTRLVEQLLVAVELDRGSAEPRGFDPLEPVLMATARLRSEGREVEIRAPEPLLAMGDPARVRIIAEQVLSNAHEFSPPGAPVRIEVSSGPGSVVIAFTDQGPGIPPQARERIFQRFVQLDGSPTRRHGGLGLGLYIARRLAESMGGSLDLDPAPGPGTTFRLRLPAPGRREGPRPHQPAPAPELPGHPPGPERGVTAPGFRG